MYKFITTLLYRRKFRHHRALLKGYRLLKEQNKLDLLANLRQILATTKLENVSLDTKKYPHIDFELAIRQFLITRIAYVSFYKALLLSIGLNKPLKHPLPKVWSTRLAKEGIMIHKTHCSLLWYGYVFVVFCYGILQGLKYIYQLIRIKGTTRNNYACFYKLSSANLPNEKRQYTIISWYLNWQQKSADISTIVHDAPQSNTYSYHHITLIKQSQLPILSYIHIGYMLVYYVYIVLYGFIGLVHRPYFSLFLLEFFTLKIFKLSSVSSLAKDYLFHLSGSFYKPLWTYEAEQKGARCLVYFYSTNEQPFRLGKTIPIPEPYHLLSWHHYITWTDQQRKFIANLITHKAVMYVVGPIPFSDESGVSIDCNTEHAISVFDITPTRPTRYILLGASVEYYIPKYTHKFLTDVYEVLTKTEHKMCHKIKRKNQYMHKQYAHQLTLLQEKKNYVSLYPQISAFRVIKETQATISLPFTSTAIIAKEMGKPSVYYDPSGLLDKNDPVAHGIPVLLTLKELHNWVESLDIRGSTTL